MKVNDMSGAQTEFEYDEAIAQKLLRRAQEHGSTVSQQQWQAIIATPERLNDYADRRKEYLDLIKFNEIKARFTR